MLIQWSRWFLQRHLVLQQIWRFTSAPLIFILVPVKSPVLRVDSTCMLHPFYVHKLDSGPVRLMTMANAFNYRVVVLRDGVRSAIRIGRSRKAETCFLTEANISWGQQVTVMFQIVSTMMVEVPAFVNLIQKLRVNHQIYSYTMNRGDMSHTVTPIVLALHQIGRLLMYTDYFLCLGIMKQQQRKMIEPWWKHRTMQWLTMTVCT